MRIVLLLAFFCLVWYPSDASNYWHIHRNREPPPPAVTFQTGKTYEGWVTQKLDHFNTSDRRSFGMRYYANYEYYKPGGPFFIYVGGEWTISMGWVTGGHMVDMAREHGGYIFYPEHRFYGQTRPTDDLSVDSLKYLDVDQALEDLAHFIRMQRIWIDGAQNSGVILVGASYSATMVSWFRQRYPDLVNGAWASSAPLHAQVDYPEYKEVVGRSISLVGGASCYQRVDRAFQQIAEAVDARKYELLEEAFNLCTPLTEASQMDMWNFFNSLSGSLSGVVQRHYIGSTTIQDACAIIEESSIEDDLLAYANFINLRMLGFCFDYQHSNTIEYFSETSWDSQVAQDEWRQWWWQTCQEYGWYQTLSSAEQPFGSRSPVELQLEVCARSYSNFFSASSVAQNVARTNTHNLGLNPQFTRVFTTHGQLDPWSAMGLTAEPNSESPVVWIPLASHCNDLYSISDDDSTELRAAKEQISKLVRDWLA